MAATNGGDTGSTVVLYPERINFEVGWWTRRSRLEKKLVMMFVVAVVAVAALIIAVAVVAGQKAASTTTTPIMPREDVCSTPACIEAAARILDTIDTTADPCGDFYGFACGGWMKENVIDVDRNENNAFIDLAKRLTIKLKNVLEAPRAAEETMSLTQAKSIYRSCMNTNRIEERGVQPLLDSLSELGRWPLLSPSWGESGFDLERMLVTLSSYDNVPIVKMVVQADMADRTRKRIYLDQPGLGMPDRGLYLRERDDIPLVVYQNHITKLAVAFGAEQSTAERDVKDLVDFEIQLANCTVPEEDRTNYGQLYNVMTLKNLSLIHPQFDWIRYAREIMKGAEIDITEDENVVNWSPSYFYKLFQLLASTDKRTVANYVIWMLVQQRTKLLNADVRNIVLEYNKVIMGRTVDTPRWTQCATYVNTAMPMAVARLFADAYFDSNAKTKVLNIITYLRDAFDTLLDEVTWIDDKTRKLAREKARAMNEKIGYPDELKNHTYMDNLYRTLSDTERAHWGFVALSTEWQVPPVAIIALYYYAWNEIVFPAGVLQYPLYSPLQPNSINFGIIGSLIGHEITHGFDNYGRLRDKNGNWNDWWDPDVIEGFETASQCIANQSSEFFFPEAQMKVNGQLTNSEDVADNGGVKQSYRAYRKWVADRGQDEPRMPGISYNHNQIFFISFAQLWCVQIRKETAVQKTLVDYHSPGRLRAVSALRNLPEFSEVFNCKPNSAMNPAKKCTVW